MKEKAILSIFIILSIVAIAWGIDSDLNGNQLTFKIYQPYRPDCKYILPSYMKLKVDQNGNYGINFCQPDCYVTLDGWRLTTHFSSIKKITTFKDSCLAKSMAKEYATKLDRISKDLYDDSRSFTPIN